MKLSKKSYSTIFLLLVSFILLISIYKWSSYLATNKYIVECFSNFQAIQEDTYSNTTSHTVNLPLNTTYSCKNFCGPTSRCSITGQQCFTDIDCHGCQPYSPPLKKSNDNCISGDDDAGKLTIGVTPQYSSLTAGYGTKAKIISDDLFSKPTQANFGVDTWTAPYNQGLKLFNKRYRPPSDLKYLPSYSKRYSLSGDFIDDGPLASNDYLNYK
jgi:hypothetical protein